MAKRLKKTIDGIWNCLKRVFKASERLILVFSSLINVVRRKCSITKKNICSKEAGGCFLVYSSLISIVRLTILYKKCGRLNQYGTHFITSVFYNLRERMFYKLLLCISLANYKKLPRTVGF